MACDLGLIFFHPTRKVPLMCDLCGDNEPLCVKACQKEALELTTNDAFSSKVRKMTVKDLRRALEAAEKAK